MIKLTTTLIFLLGIGVGFILCLGIVALGIALSESTRTRLNLVKEIERLKKQNDKKQRKRIQGKRRQR